MNFFSKARWWLSPYYVDSFEQELDEFLKSLDQSSSAVFVKQKLLEFMQQDLIRTAIYLEWKFKGYTQLKKSARRKFYKNADLIRADFADFCTQKKIDTNNKSQIVSALTKYLSPDNKFLYLESSAFFGLLKDPKTEKLVGDCNQICTLYVALAAQYFSIEYWQIHLYDAHVSLVCNNQELEATSGVICKIKFGGEILPIESLVAVNILDVSEANRNKFSIVTERFLQAAWLVKIISPNNKIAQKNLTIALQNFGLEMLKKNNFSLAEKYFAVLKNKKLLQNLYIQAVQHFVQKQNFSAAHSWAKKSESEKLSNFVYHAQAKKALEKKKYALAKKYFRYAHEEKNIKVVEESEMFEWYEKIKKLRLIKDLKRKKSLIKKIYTRAKQVENKQMKEWCENVLKEI